MTRVEIKTDNWFCLPCVRYTRVNNHDFIITLELTNGQTIEAQIGDFFVVDDNGRTSIEHKKWPIEYVRHFNPMIGWR